MMIAFLRLLKCNLLINCFMAHPFFTEIRYPVYIPEGDRFLNLVVQAISTSGEIELIYDQCAADLPRLNINQPPIILWREVLNNLCARGLLKILLKKVQERFPGNSQIQDVINQILEFKFSHEVRIVSDDVLVLDRRELRKHLQLVESETNPLKVLLIRGEPKSGKSHGRHLFERAARDNNAIPVYICDGLVATVEDVFLLLFSELGASEKIPAQNTSDEAWYRAVCFKLLEMASVSAKSLWIAVDDLGLDSDGAPLLDKEIRKFFEQFALNMMSPSFRKWFRLMLIHYPDGPVPTKWKNDFWREIRTSVADIKNEDIAEVLQLWSVSRRREVVEAEIKTLTDEIIAKVDSAASAESCGQPKLQRIHDALAQTLHNLA